MMRCTVITIFTVSILLAASTQADTYYQWSAENGGTANYYLFVDVPTDTWAQARAEAEATSYLGFPGRLATIESAEEQAFLNQHVSTVSYWLGGRQNLDSPDYSEPGGGWEWIRLPGEPSYPAESITYFNWAWNQPDDAYSGENYLEVQTDGYWNDIANDPDTGQSFAYIVEYVVPEPSTTVAFVLGGLMVIGRGHWPDRA